MTLLDTHELRLTWGTVDVGPPAINITVPLYVDDHTKWHSVNVTTKGDAILVRVDNNERTVGNVTVEKILEERMSDGGDQLLSATIGSFETNSSGRRYKGCLGEVRLGDILLPFYLRSQLSNDTSPDFFEASRVNNLETGVCRLCYDADCQQGATCLDDRNSFQCNCSVGYEGQFCEIDIDECQGVVCQNGGTCHDKVGAHVCLCQPGFEGQM